MSRLPYLVLIALICVLLVLLYLRVAPNLRQSGFEERDLPAIKVVVRNGCGIQELAADYTRYIRDKNIDVLYVGDTPHPIYNKSLIVARTGDRQDLERLQRMTGIQRHTLAIDPGYEAGFEIILGRDFEEFMK